ncbi:MULTISPECIES: DegT/DnrJ/EryC1/StrS aminotransferase family protein [unclassified Leeuwenhoekiella]|uniref:DegT/DnrJ/EryC1/StrS family aminotransferase n=1 Tax=unclassified Leeuwenhoekiella TaxID=2615029 RepID=UPI000C5B8B61|nr:MULTISPECIES: DegT/DnrJ/EryC1/StrS family aminotransferase [unclassified Leeuwenhoekiella]MAW94129.1 aminotransferase [Leeuwenhoekiella sp.]MBA82426.1 aminotransferase [Leeuwenhoekiella sp.]|tara:strand:+ start:30142 stop:31245 length:1104 start_codon:yes stop_codon:yes gene_type:complete
MNIPFLDLNKLNAPYEARFKKLFEHFLESGTYILGDAVNNFEQEFARYCGTEFCVGTGNGFDALRLIFEGYKAEGKLAEGDGVLLAANSYIATVLAVMHAGLKPVFTEAESKFFNIDLEKLDPPDTSVKVLLVTHLYGQLGPVEALSDYAKKHQLLLIEDASQAHGAEFKGKKAGSFGDAAAFSFYPTKNLGALGDAGAVTTSDESLAKTIQSLRNYGRKDAQHNTFIGLNSRLDPLQALFLTEKLKDLEELNQKRREIAKRYLDAIENPKIQLPFYAGSTNHVFYVFVVLVENRSHFLDYLKADGVGYGIHYEVPPYQQEALKRYNQLHFPVTESIAQSCVSLPLHPGLTEAEITRVIEVLNAYHA